MAIRIIKFRNGRREVWQLVAVEELSTDLKRILNMQLRELINKIEDCEDEAASVGSVRAVQFLDDCFLAA